MRLGIIGYTNTSSGIGCFVREWFDYLGDENSSILSVNSGVKGQEVWTDRQITARRPPSTSEINTYLDCFSPTHVMFCETPFAMALYPLTAQRGIKTAGVVMHETYEVTRLAADLLICPSYCAWEKIQRPAKKLLFLPIGLECFPFKERIGHTFVLNIGYGGPHDRRQSARVVEAFAGIQNPEARLIVNCQQNSFPPGVKIDDPRIAYNIGTKPEPKDIYAEGDILLAPMAYGGYERSILEGMASGMPTLTVDADPMNLFQHDKDFLLTPEPWLIKQSEWVANTWYNHVSTDALREKMEWLLTIDTPKYSRWARAQAEAQSWESG